MSADSSGNQGRYFCPMCSFTGSSSDVVTRHVNNIHSSPRNETESESKVTSTTSLSSDDPLDEMDLKCPVCDTQFLNNLVLAQHVETHFSDTLASAASTSRRAAGACAPTGEGSAFTAATTVIGDDGREFDPDKILVECPYAGCKDKLPASVIGDHLAAHDDTDSELRRATECQRLKEEDEAKQLLDLQKKYGMDASSGYFKQYEKILNQDANRQRISGLEYQHQRAMLAERRACGADDGGTGTQNLIEALRDIYTCHNIRALSFVSLCRPLTHYSADRGDSGWGCGFRNLQMMMSALLRSPTYAGCLESKLPGLQQYQVPSIPKLQELIEAAWKDGFDSAGAEQLGHRLVGTRKWIGSTDVAAVLRYCGIRARLVDFHKPSGPDKTHPSLLKWVKKYYGREHTAVASSGGAASVARDCAQSLSSRPATLNKIQVHGDKFPLYFQHQGHSRTIVGVEERQGNISLLIFDPSQPPRKMSTLLPTVKKSSAPSQSAVTSSSSSLPNRVSMAPSRPAPYSTTPLPTNARSHTGTVARAGGGGSTSYGGGKHSGAGHGGASVDGGGVKLSIPADVSRLQVIRRPLGQLKADQYQLVFIDGVFVADEKEALKKLYSDRQS